VNAEVNHPPTTTPTPTPRPHISPGVRTTARTRSKTCQTPDKVAYATSLKAEEQMLFLALHPERDTEKDGHVRKYECPAGHWHVTSKRERPDERDIRLEALRKMNEGTA
jgi:hypothetical protein